MNGFFPHVRFVFLLTFVLFGTRFCAPVLATASTELWDATTLDEHQEQRALDGTWQYMPWDQLDNLPDFKTASRVQVPIADAPGAYRRSFPVLSEKGTHRVLLHFGAVAYRAAVFVNGQFVGSHAGGFTPFEFDVTEKTHCGENELAILVQGINGVYLAAKGQQGIGETTFNEKSQASVTGGGKVAFGWGYFPREGIRQSVFVREVPLLRVVAVTLVTSLRKQRLEAKISLANDSGRSQKTDLQVVVLPYDIASKRIGNVPVWMHSQAIEAEQGLSTTQVFQGWKNPKLWMPGDPHLYVARVTLLDRASQKVRYERNVRFGFREVWTSGRKIIINGVPFRAFAHGTLANEDSPENVRTMFRKMMDVGINIVRPATMPPAPYYCRIADELGMGIIGEGELTFNHNYAFEAPVFWDNFERLFCERIARDKNHPSILLWSTANEVICSSPDKEIGQRFYKGYLRLKQVDPTRPFMQEGDGDLRDQIPGSTGRPMDIINLHLYDVSPYKNPLWTTEFPNIAWVIEDIKTNSEMPGTIKSGNALPDRNRPWFIGEFGAPALYAYPDFFSFWTGPQAYRDLFGRADELVRSVGETTTLQLQAFRDLDMAGMDPWDMPDNAAFTPYLQRALEPVTVFTRDKKAHASSGQTAQRELCILNDSFQTQPLKLLTVLEQNTCILARDQKNFLLAAGTKKVLSMSLLMPKVSVKTAVQWKGSLQNAQGKTLSEFEENWLVYPLLQPTAVWRQDHAQFFGSAEQLGALVQWTGGKLRSPAELSAGVEKLNVAKTPLIILDKTAFAALGQDATMRLLPFIEEGGVVMLLGVDTVSMNGQKLTANPESVATRLFKLRKSPLTAGTCDADWQFWQSDHFVSRGNYEMTFDPAWEFPLVSGGRNGLLYSPLAVLRHGKGALIACRLLLNEAIAKEPAAQACLNTLVEYVQSRSFSKKQMQPELVLVCRAGQEERWRACLKKVRIPLSNDEKNALVPGSQIVLLTGDACPTAGQLTNIIQFVSDGGTLWLHRLTKDTRFFDTVKCWIGDAVQFKEPAMWLQQLELASPLSPPPLLDGINDFHTCWATFAWTNGDMFSLKTTPIADFCLTHLGSDARILLQEPAWVGRWTTTANDGSLSQKILRTLGQHTPNATPGTGLAEYSLGRGRLIIDQLRWDDAMMNPASESRDKARYFAGVLWKNMSVVDEINFTDMNHSAPSGL